ILPCSCWRNLSISPPQPGGLDAFDEPGVASRPWSWGRKSGKNPDGFFVYIDCLDGALQQTTLGNALSQPRFFPHDMTSLFDPVRLGEIELPNRVVMAPVTGMGAAPRRIPDDGMRAYYAQRAEA